MEDFNQFISKKRAELSFIFKTVKSEGALQEKFLLIQTIYEELFDAKQVYTEQVQVELINEHLRVIRDFCLENLLH